MLTRARRLGLATLLATTVAAAPASHAASFKFANDGDANSMDPYTRSETSC